MEENVGLFAANGNIRSCAFGDGIRRSGDILLFFVLGELLVMASLVLLQFLSACVSLKLVELGCAHSRSTEVGIGHSQLLSGQPMALLRLS